MENPEKYGLFSKKKECFLYFVEQLKSNDDSIPYNIEDDKIVFYDPEWEKIRKLARKTLIELHSFLKYDE